MFRRLLTAALVLAVFAPVVAAQEENSDAAKRPAQARTDVVFLLDVSGSMRKHRGLARAREVLSGVVDKVVHPGTSVAVIPFGTGVQKGARFEIPNDPRGAAAQRDAIRDTIARIRARDSYTYLYDAIHQGLATLMEFKDAAPEHARHIILISDGKQVVRRGYRARTLAEILDHFERAGFKRGEDWFIWYGHFGAPDDRLKHALESTGAGRAISLDDLPSLQWAYTRLTPRVIDLGRRRPGDWTKKVAFVAQTDESGLGKTVSVELQGEFPEGMSVEIEPRSVKLEDVETRVTVKVTCKGGVAGAFTGTKLVVAPEKGTLHWVESGTIEMPFTVGKPRIDAGSRRIALGRVAPGSTRTRTLALIPNEDAASTAPELKLAPVDVTKGVSVSLDQPTVRVGQRVEVAVTVTVPRDMKPGSYSCRVRLDGGGAVDVVPAEVRIDYRVGFGHVTVGEDRVAFASVLPGGNALSEITLTPDDDTAAVGTRVKVEVVDLSGPVSLEVPMSVAVRGRKNVPVTVTVPSGTEAGVYTAKLRFTAPEGVRVEPAEIPVSVRVRSVATLSLPPLVDLGDVPASRAREVAGRLELVVPPAQLGSELELVSADDTVIEPRVIPLRPGKSLVPVRLRSVQTAVGEHKSRFKAVLVADGERKELGEVSFRWRVAESYVRVKSFAAPGAVGTGDGVATGRLVVESSSDLTGRQVRLAATFGALAAGMGVDVDVRAVTLQGGLQTIPVRMQVKGARAGHYDGTLRVGLTEDVPGVTPAKTVRVTLDVAGAVVQVVAVEGSLEGLAKGDTRELKLVLAAAAVPVPTTLELAFDRSGMPAGVEADIPVTVQLDQAEGTVHVPLRFVMNGEVAAGQWTTRVTVKARTAGVAVAPESVQVRASVPQAVTVVKVQKAQDRTAMWIAIGVGALLLVIVLVVAMRRRRAEPQVVHVSVPTPVEEEPLNELAEDDDMFVLEGFESEEQ